jgi:uncharacterized RDD family membrane protein YckC
MQNDQRETRCFFCGKEIDEHGRLAEVKIFADLTRYPYRALLQSIREFNVVISIIVLPIISFMYGLRKVLRQPLLSCILNSQLPKYRFTSIKVLEKPSRHSFERAYEFLRNRGFETVLDVEDVSMVQGNVERVMVNRAEKVYASIVCKRHSGRVQHVAFYSTTLTKTCICVDNAFTVDVELPPDMIVVHRPKLSIEKTYEQFIALLESYTETRVMLELKYLFWVWRKVRIVTIEKGIEQEKLFVKNKQPSHLSVCYSHPFSIAVRRCEGCGAPLCEACYTPFQGKHYCSNCLPQEAKSYFTHFIPLLPDRYEFAGISIRTVANSIDTVLLVAATALIYTVASQVLKLYVPGHSGTALSLVVTEIFFILGGFLYGIVPVVRFGQTAGKWMCGVRVIDHAGKRPDWIAAFIRYAYMVLSCLFLFPLLGYAPIVFRKTRQGIHDQLSRTFVVTRNGRTKSYITRPVSVVIAVVTVVLIVTEAIPLVDIIVNGYSPRILLEKEWEQRFNSESQFAQTILIRNHRCVLYNGRMIQSVDIRTGIPVWSIDSLTGVHFLEQSKKDGFPFIVYQKQDQSTVLYNIEPDKGTIIWKISCRGITDNFLSSRDILIAHNERRLSAFSTIDGRVLWEYDSDSGIDLRRVILNDGVLVYGQCDSHKKYYYLDPLDGEVQWRMSTDSIYPGFALDHGYHLFTAPDGRGMLWYLPEQKRLWTSSFPVGYLSGYHSGSLQQDSLFPLLLYTNTMAIRGTDGTVLFNYPRNTRFIGENQRHLFLVRSLSSDNEQGIREELYILDKKNGDVIKQWKEARVYGTVLIGESARAFYLGAHRSVPSFMTRGVPAELVKIDKLSLSHSYIVLGYNVLLMQCAPLRGDSLIFIPSFSQIGVYKLPY